MERAHYYSCHNSLAVRAAAAKVSRPTVAQHCNTVYIHICRHTFPLPVIPHSHQVVHANLNRACGEADCTTHLYSSSLCVDGHSIYALLCHTRCISVCMSVKLHDTSHCSPWLCAPPSPSSVSVRLLSIPASQQYSSSAAERCHQSSSRRRLSLHSAHNVVQPQKRRESRVEYMPAKFLLAPHRQWDVRREAAEEREGFFPPLCESSS